VLSKRHTLVLALPLGASLLLAGCGGSSSSGGSGGTAGSGTGASSAPASSSAASGGAGASTGAGAGGGTNAAAAALVPSSVKGKGTLTVAADASYAPNEFFKPGTHTIVGMDVDLAQAIGKELGLKVNVVNQTFDSIIPGIQAGRYDLGMSSFTDTKKREQVVDFVTYFNAGTSFFVKQGSPQITSLDQLCGLSVAVEKGTTQADDGNAQSAKCTSAGKKPVKVDQYPDQGGANVALSSGRDSVAMADSPVAAYAVKQSNGAFQLSGSPYGTAPYGIAMPKGNAMAKAVQAALKALIADGTYKNILGTWGVQNGAITNPVINGAQS